MKKIFKYLAIAFLAVGMVSCDKEKDEKVENPIEQKGGDTKPNVKVEGNKITVVQTQYGAVLTTVYLFEDGKCVSAISTTEFTNAELAQSAYKEVISMLDEEVGIQVRVEGNKLIVDYTVWYEGFDMDTIKMIINEENN